MSKIHYTLSTKIDSRGKSQILMRFIATKEKMWRGKTGIFVSPDNWDDENGMPKTARRDAQDKWECAEVRKRLSALTTALLEKYDSEIGHGDLWLKNALQNIRWNTDGTLYITSKTSFAALHITDSLSLMIETDLRNKVIEQKTANNYIAFRKKFEDFEREIRPCLVRDFDEDCFTDLLEYIRKNYKASDNSFAGHKQKALRWWHWCRAQDRSLPEVWGSGVKTRAVTYGTPVYLTKEERNKLYKAPMPNYLVEQTRDVFVFQCLVGCRVSDLTNLTFDNLRDGSVVYIAKKTIHSAPQTITVPLHPIAQEIIKKYKKPYRKLLVPVPTGQQYNYRIRKAFKASGIDRKVTIRDSHSGLPRQVWLSDVATSHMARRTFVGCLYEEGFRESDICSMSGHQERSISIQRYRRTSDDIKQKMIDSI